MSSTIMAFTGFTGNTAVEAHESENRFGPHPLQ